MTKFEDILDIAISRLQAGDSPKQIAADYPEHSEELIGLLSVMENGIQIPKLVPPTPIKRRLYEQKLSKKSWLLDMLMFTRVAAIPIALLVALVGGRAIVNATESSLPGDTLYSLKRATEEARLTLTSNPEKLANIHVELMQKRVNDVRKAADNGDQDVETKAIAALQSQTSKTFAEAAPLATANAISKQDSTLLDSLLAINKEQKDLLSDVTASAENSDTKEVATTALADNKKNDQTLAKIVATVNDQTLIDLPNKVAITGSINYHYGNKITVEKNTFVIDDKTTITDANNELIVDVAKTLAGRVSIVGLKENGQLLAKQIVLLPNDDSGVVKGVADPATGTGTTPTKPAVKPSTTPKPTTTPTNSNTNVNSNTPAAQVEGTTDKASGTFITEPSDPQYSF